MRSGWGTIFKPLAWQGDLVFGPNRGTRPTFMTPEAASNRWAGLPPLDEAWPRVVAAYLGAYGPAGPTQFSAWLSRGTVANKTLKTWFKELHDDGQLAVVEVDGEPLYVRSSDADDLAGTKASKQVRLLGGFDQWVLGPGTDDGHVTPAARRRAVSKTAGWIAPVVVVGGAVCGTWEQKNGQVSIAWFPEAGAAPVKAIETEVRRLSVIIDRDLTVAIKPAGKA